MKYKEQVLKVVENYLLTHHTQEEVDDMLGGWQDKTLKDARNEVIEDAIEDVMFLIQLITDYRYGNKDCKDIHSVVVKFLPSKPDGPRWKNKLKTPYKDKH